MICWDIQVILVVCSISVRSGTATSHGNALILLPDDTADLTDDFRSLHRDLYFSGLKVSIEQNWRDVGVAAVVWEAVCNR